MKKLSIFLLSTLIIISFLTSCRIHTNEYEYLEAEWFPVPFMRGDTFYDEAKPLIKKFDGDTFASRNITADGHYTGYTTGLGSNENVFYCENDGSIIFQSPSNGFIRLNKDGTINRLCTEMECREDMDAQCTHMNDYWSSMYCYSNGILYFGVTNYIYMEQIKEHVYCGSYVLSYDLQTNTLKKIQTHF